MLIIQPDRANQRSEVARIDPASNDVTSTTTVDTVADDAIATAEGAWLLDGTTGVLTRLDPTTQRATARVELGAPPPNPAPDVPPAMLAASGSTIWATVGDARKLSKIDATSGAVVATFELGAPPANLAAGPEGVYVELILPPRAAVDPDTADLPRAERRTDEIQYRAAERSQLQLLDAATGTVRTELETYALRTFAVGPGGLYSSDAYTELKLRDPVTLVELVSGDHLTFGFAFAEPGVWLTGEGGLVAVDASSLAKRARVPDVTSTAAHSFVAAFGSLWVVEWGGATRVRAGADR